MPTILIVDDEKSVCEMIKEMIQLMGHDTFEANDGETAIAIINSHHIDLLITDIIMPGQNGIDLILNIRRSHPRMSIIAISGGNMDPRHDYLKTAKLLGADRVIRKPFSIGELHQAVNSSLS